MMTPTLTSNPYALSIALHRIARREREARRRAERVGFFTRVFAPRKAHAMTSHVVRLGPRETVISNL